MDTQGKTNIMDIQGKENTMDIQEKGSSMGIQGRKSIVGIQGEGSIMDTQGKGSSVDIQGNATDIQGEGSSMDTRGEGSIVDTRVESSTAGISGEGDTIAGLPGANGAAETPGEGPADGGGQTPGAHPAVMALEVVDAILRAAAKGNPLTEAAARRAMARVEGIARRDPRALLGLRALLARLSRALRQQRDLHAQIMGLGEDLGEALAESCAPPDDAFSLALIARRALWRARAYQSLYRFTRACDARCEELHRRRAEP